VCFCGVLWISSFFFLVFLYFDSVFFFAVLYEGCCWLDCIVKFVLGGVGWI